MNYPEALNKQVAHYTNKTTLKMGQSNCMITLISGELAIYIARVSKDKFISPLTYLFSVKASEIFIDLEIFKKFDDNYRVVAIVYPETKFSVSSKIQPRNISADCLDKYFGKLHSRIMKAKQEAPQLNKIKWLATTENFNDQAVYLPDSLITKTSKLPIAAYKMVSTKEALTSLPSGLIIESIVSSLYEYYRVIIKEIISFNSRELISHNERIQLEENSYKNSYSNLNRIFTRFKFSPSKFRGFWPEAIKNLCDYYKIKQPKKIDHSLYSDSNLSNDSKISSTLDNLGLSCRKIRLFGEWWQSASLPILILGKKNNVILLLPDKNNKYYYYESGIKMNLDFRAASQLGSTAFIVYPTFNERVNLRQILSLLFLGSKKNIIMIVMLAFFISVMGLFTPVLTSHIISVSVPNMETASLIVLPFVLMILSISKLIFEYIRIHANIDFSIQARINIQSAVMNQFLKLPLSTIKQYSLGGILYRLNGFTNLIEALSGNSLVALLNGLFAGLSLLLLYYYSWKIATFIVFITIIYLFVIMLFSYLRLKSYQEALPKYGKLRTFSVTILNNIEKIKVCAIEQNIFSQWTDNFIEYFTIKMRADNYGVIITSFVDNSKLFILIGIFIIIGYFYIDKSLLAMYIGLTVAFGQYWAGVTGFISTITENINSIAVIKKSLELLKQPVEISEKRQLLQSFRGSITLNNVSFSMANSQILDNICISVDPEETIAIVGPSGSGKTTLLKLLLNFYEPDSGEIKFDNRDINFLDVKALRKDIGVVMQDMVLYGDTIIQNIVGNDKYPQEVIDKVIRQVNLEEDIKKMPMGLRTIISNSSKTLSGGQIQKILLARALIRKPKLLLLDEATSSLDNNSQKIITECLANFKATQIIVAHRLSTIKHADKIYFINRAIIEKGTYHQLIEAKGEFYRMFKFQI